MILFLIFQAILLIAHVKKFIEFSCFYMTITYYYSKIFLIQYLRKNYWTVFLLPVCWFQYWYVTVFCVHVTVCIFVTSLFNCCISVCPCDCFVYLMSRSLQFFTVSFIMFKIIDLCYVYSFFFIVKRFFLLISEVSMVTGEINEGFDQFVNNSVEIPGESART